MLWGIKSIFFPPKGISFYSKHSPLAGDNTRPSEENWKGKRTLSPLSVLKNINQHLEKPLQKRKVIPEQISVISTLLLLSNFSDHNGGLILFLKLVERCLSYSILLKPMSSAKVPLFSLGSAWCDVFAVFQFSAVLSSQQMTIGKIYCAKLIYENYKHMKKKRLEKKKKVINIRIFKSIVVVSSNRSS